MGTILVILAVVFILGFVLDWIQIILIILPLVGPIIGEIGSPSGGMWAELGFAAPEQALVWFTVVFAVVLQTSFLTPPVGFALFYVKGVAPPQVTVRDIYRGIVPFILLQLTGVAIIFLWSDIVTWLPSVALGR